jgi:hypothetical protein
MRFGQVCIFVEYLVKAMLLIGITVWKIVGEEEHTK